MIVLFRFILYTTLILVRQAQGSGIPKKKKKLTSDKMRS